MAERKALVLIDGDLSELPSGDTLTGAGSGGGAGGDGNLYEPTSYSHPFGSGNRESTITIASTANITYDLGHMVDGDNSGSSLTACYFSAGQSNETITFTFPEKLLIDEVTWKQDIIASQGNWKLQGSNDGTNFDDLSADVDLGGSATTTITRTLETDIGYSIYRLTQVSGTTSSANWIQEVEFKAGSIIIPIVPNQQTEITAATYTITDADLSGDRVLQFNNASGVTVTVPDTLTGEEPVTIIQTGAGTLSFATSGSAVIRSLDNNTDTAGQFASVSIVPDKITANQYFLIGALA